MTDAPSNLVTLQQMLEQTTDLAQRAVLEQMIALVQTTAHGQAIAGEAQIGAAIAGNVGRNINAPLFQSGASGNFVVETLNIVYGGPKPAAPADYEAALRRYLDDLYTRHSTIDLRGIDEQRPVEIQLADLYISLTLREPPPSELRGWGSVRRFMSQNIGRLLGREDEEEAVAGEPQRHLSWGDTLRAHMRLAVIGRPGSGKTTLLHYTTIRLAEALARDDRKPLDELGLPAPLVPLLLPLREFGSYLRESRPRELSGNGPRLLLDCLENYYNGRNLALPPDFFSRLCEQGRAILLLDGLDEVSRTDERELVSGIVREFAARYRNCRYVVSARVAAYVGAVDIGAGFQICTVDDLDEDQQQRFIANWSTCVHSLIYPKSSADQILRMAEEFNTTLWQALTENRGVGQLAPNPLLLTVIAIVFFNRRDLPENRAQLYDECVKVCLVRVRARSPVDEVGKGEWVTPQRPVDPDTGVMQRGQGRKARQKAR